ncbi:uncharacterized protein [Eleutherodactylus coqui]|uniref:uncharacterized protein n=1 Tax=Eleutherodactylus coqui TaxID=57060 RepID=UPI00346206EC
MDIKVEVIDEAEEPDIRADQQYGVGSRNQPETCQCPTYSQSRPEEDVPENRQGDNLMEIKVEVKDEEEELDIKADQQYGAGRRNPPERCPHPLYTQDSPEEDVPENQQRENMMDIKVEVKDEAEESDIRADQQYGAGRRNLPERCPCSPYSQDRPEEDVPENQQGDNLMDIKVEVIDEAEEPDIRADQQYGARMGNPPEKCPRPPYSPDRPEEDVPENQQGENLMDIKVEVKDEEEEPDIRADQQYGAGRRNPPERCLRPPYSPDHTEEDVLANQQGEDDIKVEVEEERMRGDHPWKSEVEEDVPAENPHETSEGNFMLSVNDKVEDEDIVQPSSGENLITINVPPGLHSTDPSYNPPNYEKISDQSQMVTTSADRSNLYPHIKIHTRNKMYPCPECGKCFSSKSYLTEHEGIHTGEKPFTCSECGRSFRSKGSLVIHERTHTGEKPFTCSECGKGFTNKSDMVKHQRYHTGEKPYSCSECGRGFIAKGKLTDHEKTHTGERSYSCAECGRTFINKSGLNTHLKKHTEDKQKYLCSKCEICFVSILDLANHLRSHTGEKLYSCSECGKGFITKGKLTDHEKTHTEERSYSCAECGKTLINKSSLNRHLKKHAEDKQKYSCSKCEKYFSSIPDLANHLRSHTGEKPF